MIRNNHLIFFIYKTMKTFNEFLLEKKSSTDTGINKDIIKLSTYIIEYMNDNKLKRYNFSIKELSLEFPFLKDWPYVFIVIGISPKFINKTAYLKYSNSVGIYLKAPSKATLNHELIHVLQSTIDRNILLIDYENNTVLNQIKNFFQKISNKIGLLETMLYFADDREMGAFIHSFKKYDKNKRVEILSYILLIKHFKVENLITDKNLLYQFITIWEQYQHSPISFFNRRSIQRRINNNTLELNDQQIQDFMRNINKKLNKSGIIYMDKLNNQYNTNDDEMEKFIKLLDLAKTNIIRNDFKNIMNLEDAKKIKLSSTQNYYPNWEN